MVILDNQMENHVHVHVHGTLLNLPEILQCTLLDKYVDGLLDE